MNLCLQFAIPLAVTGALLVVIAALRRYRGADAWIVCAAVLALAAVTGTLGVRSALSLRAEDPAAQEAAISYDQTENDLLLAQRYALDGCYDEADALLGSGTDGASVLARARLFALRGRWAQAALLYEKAAALGADVPDDELGAAAALVSADGGGSMAAFLSAQGADPAAYGIAAANSAPDAETAAARVENALRDLLDEQNSGAAEAAELAARITSEFSALRKTGEFDETRVRRAVSDLGERMDADPALGSNAGLRLARLKGCILLGRYDDVAAGLDDGASLPELMVASDLYTSGLVRGSDFAEDFTGRRDERAERVVAQCERIFDAALSDSPRAVRRSYEEKLDSLKSLTEHTAPAALRRAIGRAVPNAGTLESKAYLSLARLEQYGGNETAADAYLDAAFGTVSTSDDAQYTVPMSELLGIISGSSAGGTEDLKKVAALVDEALDSATPVPIPAAQADPAADADTEQESFAGFMTGSVSRRTAVLNIGAIDKTEFPRVRARIQVSASGAVDESSVKQILQVRDCGSAIGEFEIEHLEYDVSRVTLLCDVSGSMSGSVDSLKNAVIRFAENMDPGEEVRVVCFDDNITYDSGFTSDPDTVAAAAGQIGAYGGTNMFSALEDSLGSFPEDVRANNIAILLTDGEDNDPRGEKDIRDTIGALAARNAATVYTLGLGASVDTEYLTLLADAGNGSFLYVDSDESLAAFYDFIHRQLTSQYVLTYTAKNTTLNERTLALSVTDELGRAEKTYYLQEPEYSNAGKDNFAAYTVVDDDLTVYGLSTKLLYRASRAQTVLLRGEGFDAGDEITVQLAGAVEYELSAVFRDKNTYALTVPANVAMGVYDLKLSLRGESVTLEHELTLAVPGTEKSYRYGAYEFTALQLYTAPDGAVTLSGGVTMNGYLHFRGDVTITGAQRDTDYVTVTDNAGSYVAYAADNSRGLAAYMARKGVDVVLPALGSFAIYNDPYDAGDYEDFPVDAVSLNGDINFMFFVSGDQRVSVYPDGVQLDVFDLGFHFPLQKQLARGLPQEFQKSYDAAASMMLSATDVGLIASVSFSDFTDYDDDAFNFVTLPAVLTSFDADIDTIANDYSIEMEISFKALGECDSLGAGLEWKDGKFDAISLSTGGTSVDLVKTPVPIAMRDFGFKLSGFSEHDDEKALLANLLLSPIEVNFEVTAGDIQPKFPKLAEFLTGERGKALALASLKDCKLTCTLKELQLAFEADLNLLNVLDCGKCEIELGKFDYTNELLGFYKNDQAGARVKLTLGSKWESKSCYVQLQGSGEIVLGYPVCASLWLNGQVGYDIGWWILRADWNVAGDALIGIYENSRGEMQFSLIVRGTNEKGKYSGVHLYITPSTGLDTYFY